MTTNKLTEFKAWIESESGPTLIASEGNGGSRGDGYDTSTYRLDSGRYLVWVWEVPRGPSHFYVANTRDAAAAVIASGWGHGEAPANYYAAGAKGHRYDWIAKPWTLKEYRDYLSRVQIA